MEKQRKPSEGGDKLGGDPFGGNNDKANTLLVCSDPHREQLPVVGMTVGEVMKQYAQQLEIHGDATPIVDGTEVDKNHKLGAGEMLMFIHKAGEKG